MKILVDPCGGDLDLTAADGRHWLIRSLSEHDLRDLEFVLAQRRAMARRCGEEHGEHTCGLAPGHGTSRHLCRGCMQRWPVQ